MLQTWIGVSTSGRLVIGHGECVALARAGELSEAVAVWPVQLPYRCAALLGDRWSILTPTDARARGATRIQSFRPVLLAMKKEKAARKPKKRPRGRPSLHV